MADNVAGKEVHQFIKDAHSMKDPRKFYDDHSSTYNQEISDSAYRGPQTLVPFILKYLNPGERILDVAAGTGEVARLLHPHGFRNMHALDASPKMLEVAKAQNLYQSYTSELLSEDKPCSFEAESFDSLVSVGGIAYGGMNPNHYNEFVRLVKKGGLMIFGANEKFEKPHENWPYDADKVCDKLESDGKARMLEKSLVSDYAGPYCGVFRVYQKL